MSGYKLHPLCEKFPPMPDAEFKELVEDIRANGQREPIWAFGKFLLDGKHRLDACELLGRKPDVREFHPKHGPEEPQIKAFVLSKNFYRRHLNASQRAMIAAELVTTDGKGNPNAAEAKKDPESRSNAQECAFDQTAAAAAASVSRRSVQEATAVLESGSKPLQQAVRDGDVSVSDAAKIVDLPKAEQTAAVKAVESGEAKTVSAAAGKPRKPRKKKQEPAREPGEDETEDDHKPRTFNDQSIDDAFGKLIRLVDERANVLGGKNGAYHKACLNRLNDFLKAMKEWRSVKR